MTAIQDILLLLKHGKIYLQSILKNWYGVVLLTLFMGGQTYLEKVRPSRYNASLEFFFFNGFK